MSYELHQDKHQFSGGLAATALIPRMPVKFAGTSAILFSPVGSWNEEPHGHTGAATHLAGEVPAVYFSQNIVKARCIASVGAGVAVGVGSTNGGVAPVAAASGVVRWQIGQTLTTAAAGEIVSVFINPRQLSGTP